MLHFILSAIRATIPAGTPLLFGTLGEVYTERSGVLNLGVEGMMIMGAITGFGVTHATGNVWLGILAAALAGGLLALLHAFACITLHLNQVVSGLALTMLGLGLSGILGRQFIGQPLPVEIPQVHIPGHGINLSQHQPGNQRPDGSKNRIVINLPGFGHLLKHPILTT